MDKLSRVQVSLTVNGQPYQRTVEPRLTLADFLRDELGLTGTHLGCEHGVCGACTVLVDGRAVRSCLMFAVQADSCTILTVEGLTQDGQLHPLQEAFMRHNALQCGFCTPGFLMSALDFLEDIEPGAQLTEDDVRVAISGNICRCTGYQGIVRAIAEVANGRTAGER